MWNRRSTYQWVDSRAKCWWWEGRTSQCSTKLPCSEFNMTTWCWSSNELQKSKSELDSTHLTSWRGSDYLKFVRKMEGKDAATEDFFWCARSCRKGSPHSYHARLCTRESYPSRSRLTYCPLWHDIYPYLCFEYPNKYLNKCFAYTHDKDAKDKVQEKDPSAVWKMSKTNPQSRRCLTKAKDIERRFSQRQRCQRHLSVRQRCQRRMGRFPDVEDILVPTIQCSRRFLRGPKFSPISQTKPIVTYSWNVKTPPRCTSHKASYRIFAYT